MTGTPSWRAASGGGLSPEPPRATNSEPEPIGKLTILYFFGSSSIFSPKIPLNRPNQPNSQFPTFPGLACSDREQTSRRWQAVLTGQCGESGADKIMGKPIHLPRARSPGKGEDKTGGVDLWVLNGRRESDRRNRRYRRTPLHSMHITTEL